MLIVLSNGQVMSQWDVEQERAGENQHKEVSLSKTEATILRARMKHGIKAGDKQK